MIYAPSDRPYLDLRTTCTFYFHSDCDPYDLDDPKFPLLKHAWKYEITLEPGDVLWVPPFMWHQVENPTESIGIAYRFMATRPNIFLHFLVTMWKRRAGDLQELLQMVAHQGMQHAGGGVARAVGRRRGQHPAARLRVPCRLPSLPVREAGSHRRDETLRRGDRSCFGNRPGLDTQHRHVLHVGAGVDLRAAAADGVGNDEPHRATLPRREARGENVGPRRRFLLQPSSSRPYSPWP